jgi:hypothetical protein
MKISRKYRERAEGADVLGDPLVRVVDDGAGVELVELAVAEVALEEAVGQPAPPVDAQGVADIEVEREDRHRHQQQHHAELDRIPEARLVAGRQGRGEFAGLLVEHHREARLAQQQDDQQGQQPHALSRSSPRQ